MHNPSFAAQHNASAVHNLFLNHSDLSSASARSKVQALAICCTRVQQEDWGTSLLAVFLPSSKPVPVLLFLFLAVSVFDYLLSSAGKKNKTTTLFLSLLFVGRRTRTRVRKKNNTKNINRPQLGLGTTVVRLPSLEE